MEKPFDVPVFTDNKTASKGISVFAEGPVHATGKDSGIVHIAIDNLLDEDVFVEVTGSESLGIDFRDGPSHAGGGGSFPSSHHANLLRMLKACSYSQGKPISVGDESITGFKGKIDYRMPDLARWIGTDTSVMVPVNGYLRRNGKRFSSFVKVPIRLVK